MEGRRDPILRLMRGPYLVLRPMRMRCISILNLSKHPIALKGKGPGGSFLFFWLDLGKRRKRCRVMIRSQFPGCDRLYFFFYFVYKTNFCCMNENHLQFHHISFLYFMFVFSCSPIFISYEKSSKYQLSYARLFLS